MPLKRQTAAAQMHAEDVDLAYAPPPGSREAATHTTRVASQPPPTLDQERDKGPSAWDQLRERAAQAAATRAARAEQSAQARAAHAAERASSSSDSKANRPDAVARPTRTAVLAPGVGWRQQMYVYTMLLLIGYGVWVLDGAFTVVGAVTTVLPLTIIGIVIAIAGHLFLSWGQHTLIFHPHLAIKGIGLVLLGLNATSNIYGISGAVRVLRPGLLGTLPADPRDWVASLATWLMSLISQQANPDAPVVIAPTWALTALIVLIVAVVLAWFAEKIRDYFQAQWNAQWAMRPN